MRAKMGEPQMNTDGHGWGRGDLTQREQSGRRRGGSGEEGHGGECRGAGDGGECRWGEGEEQEGGRG